MFASFPDWLWVVLVPGAVLALVFGIIAFVRAHLHICEPNEVLIFSGRNRKTNDGRDVGFRVVFGGRAFRMPILEEVKKMDMTLISVPMAVGGAYSEGGIPLAVTAIANIKVSSDPILVNNAIERLLDKSRDEVARVAKETLEGHLRGVLATMTPEEVNDDRLKFAERLSDEAGHDLAKLGLQLDTLKIQQVSDDRSYLDSIGRKQIAQILSAAEVAESNAVREAEEAEAAANARGEVARTRAHANVLQRQNELRQLKAELDALARSEEEIAEQAVHAARAEAEAELQTVRAQVAQLRLTADVKIPAEIERRVSELLAQGEASAIAAKGEALALALHEIDAAWKMCGDDAADMIVVQNIDEIFSRVTKAAAGVQARKVSLLDSGDGSTVASYVDAYPATVQVLLDRISSTFGVDVSGVLRGAMATRRDTTPPASGDAEAA